MHTVQTLRQHMRPLSRTIHMSTIDLHPLPIRGLSPLNQPVRVVLAIPDGFTTFLVCALEVRDHGSHARPSSVANPRDAGRPHGGHSALNPPVPTAAISPGRHLSPPAHFLHTIPLSDFVSSLLGSASFRGQRIAAANRLVFYSTAVTGHASLAPKMSFRGGVSEHSLNRTPTSHEKTQNQSAGRTRGHIQRTRVSLSEK